MYKQKLMTKITTQNYPKPKNTMENEKFISA